MPDQNSYYYIKHFNTELTPQEEDQFKSWADKYSEKIGRSVYNDIANYDIKGYWKNEVLNGKNGPDERGHLTDTYKKPNHPTFSTESMYNGYKDPNTGNVYVGGVWGEDDSFTPSVQMLQSQPKGFLQQYFKQYEPTSKLILPNQ